MNISSIFIQNFRKLYQCHIDFSNDTTLFVGANNSGKTSAMDALGKFLAGRAFNFNDITISNRELINKIGEQWETVDCEKPDSISEWSKLLPTLDVWLNVEPQDIHYVLGIIPTLKWRGGLLGVRLIYQPKKIDTLFSEYREAFFAARTIPLSVAVDPPPPTGYYKPIQTQSHINPKINAKMRQRREMAVSIRLHRCSNHLHNSICCTAPSV